MTTAERYFSFLETQYVGEDGSRRQPAPGRFVQHLTTGPDRTPLQPWTPAQVAAYRKQRLKERK